MILLRIANVLLLLALAATSAQAASVKDVFEKHGLIGMFSANCSKPASASNLYFLHRAIDNDRVQRDVMNGPESRESITIIHSATEANAKEVVVGGQREPLGEAVNVTVHLEADRFLVWDYSIAGTKVIAGGKRAGSSESLPWISKCAQKLTIQSAPEGGGKCLEVPRGEIKAGANLWMWDCNATPAQTFSFDGSNGRLAVGGLCVDGGRGQQGNALQLVACNGGASQVWKPETNGTNYKITGANGLCVDISHYSKDNRAEVHLWRCHGGPNQRWLLR